MFGTDKIAPEFGTKMRRVKAAEDSVPISVVALRTEEKITRLRNFLRTASFGAALRDGGQARAGAQHFFVKQIGFGIFAEEAAPTAAAQKCGDFRTLGEFVVDEMKALANSGG